MARIRSIHPGIFTDETFAMLSAPAKILWIGIWTEADDQGVFQWKPITLKMRLLPASTEAADPLLAELLDADCVRKFSHGGREFGAVRNFQKFQRPKKPNAVHFLPSELRTYVGSKEQNSEPDDEEGGSSSELEEVQSAPSSEPVGNQCGTGGEIAKQMEDGGESRVEKKEPPIPPTSQSCEDGSCEDGRRGVRDGPSKAEMLSAIETAFTEFWSAYPRKVGKGQARKAYLAALRKPGVTASVLVGAVRKQRFDDRPQFIPHPATWLNGERWLDERASGDPVLRAAGLNDDGTLRRPGPDDDWLDMPGGNA